MRRYRERLAEEVIQKQKEAEEAHAAAIRAVVDTREQDLRYAAEWWRQSSHLHDFINACEQRWRKSAGELTAEQISWLEWARAIAEDTGPFADGYPDPAKHGTFDAAAIPFGGPYPTAQEYSPPQ